jgi:hypothetical protein
MTKSFALSALITACLALPALAHEGAHPKQDHKLTSPLQDGACEAVISDHSLAMLEQSYRDMPQSTRMNLQHVMRHAGLYDGSDDGVWGPMTECAIASVASKFPGAMSDATMISFYEYMLSGGFISDYPGTPNPFPHQGVLY